LRVLRWISSRSAQLAGRALFGQELKKCFFHIAGHHIVGDHCCQLVSK